MIVRFTPRFLSNGRNSVENPILRQPQDTALSSSKTDGINFETGASNISGAQSGEPIHAQVTGDGRFSIVDLPFEHCAERIGCRLFLQLLSAFRL